MAKFVSSFQSARDKTSVEADEYYLTRHVPFIRSFFLDSVPAIELYVPHLAVQCWSEGQVRAPTAWRWVVTLRRRGTEYRPDAATQAHIDADHVAFLSGLRACHVIPVVQIDGGGRVGEGCKVMIEYVCADPTERAAAGERYTAIRDEFVAMMRKRPGVRLCITNEVRAELATQAITEPMQKLGHGFRDTTDRIAVDEVWFQDVPAAERVLRSAEPWELWRAGELVPTVHQATELVVVDRR